MKLVFLDFDGVLNSNPFLYAEQAKRRAAGLPTFDNVGDGDAYMIDPKNVKHLNTIVEATGAGVVVSSTWRILHSQDQLGRFLRSAGFTGKILGVTPRGTTKKISGDVQRGHEIDEVVSSPAAHIGVDTVEAFVILDDNSDMAHLRHRLVQTSDQTGLTETEARRAIEMLG